MNTPSINYDDVVEMYNNGVKIADIAAALNVVPDTVEYALRTRGVSRNRLNNPDNHSHNLAAIKSRIYRARRRLEAMLETGSAADIKEAAETLTREKGLLEAANIRRKSGF